MAQAQSIDARSDVLDALEAGSQKTLDALIELARVPGVSADGFDRAEVARSAEVAAGIVEAFGLQQVEVVAVAASSACALSAGEVRCWARGLPQEVCLAGGGADAGCEPLTDIVNLAAGGDDHCALRSDGGVLCWRAGVVEGEDVVTRAGQGEGRRQAAITAADDGDVGFVR